MKRGRFSVEETQYIEQNCEALSPEAIAEQLDQRSLHSIHCLDQKECRDFLLVKQKEASCC